MADQTTDVNAFYYQHYYQFKGRSQWMEKIWSEAFGEHYPPGLEHYGYVTQTDLDTIAAMLPCVPGDSILDIGCGKGGPGIKIAQARQLQLNGIDIVAEAVEQAKEFVKGFDLEHPVQFLHGQFYSIPFDDAVFDAVISIDSIWAATDKLQALTEVKRVMKPGTQFIFTHWDLVNVESIPIFEESGLKFVSRSETPHWKEFQRKVYEGISSHETELVLEMGAAANMLIYEATASPPHLDNSVRRLYCMEKA